MLFAGTEYGPDNPLLISAAGLCKSFDIDRILQLMGPSDGVVLGSFTWEQRNGNDGVCENFDNSLFGLNSWGMPNGGRTSRPTGGDEPPELYQRYQQSLILSVAGFNPLEYDQLVRDMGHLAGVIELNFGCPNVRDDGAQHKIISFDPESIHQVLDLIGAFDPKQKIWVKLSPYSDPGLLKEVAAVIAAARRHNGAEVVEAVVTCNTFPNGVGYTSDRRPALKTNQAGRYGGISGHAMKPFSLSNAAQFVEQFASTEVSVIRCGGIDSGEDIWQSYDVGCEGVQIHTAMAANSSVLNRFRQEYADILG